MEYSRLKKDLDDIKSELALNRRSHFANNVGFHFYCIKSFTEMSNTNSNILPTCYHQLKYAIASITLVLIQLISLFILSFEARLTQFNYYQDCKKLNGCADSYYCELHEEKCWSCEYSITNCSEEIDSEAREELADNHSDWEVYTVTVGPVLSEDEYDCLSNLYCTEQEEQNLFDNDVPCPCWENREMDAPFNVGICVVLIFVEMILAYSIYKEINQVLAEEAYYDKVIGKSERGFSFAANLFRMSLLLRRTYLPMVSFSNNLLT